MRHLKKILFVFLLLFHGYTPALWADESIAFAMGPANSDLFVARVALRETWSSQWFESSVGALGAFNSFSANHWWDSADSISAVAYSPVFIYRFKNAYLPYVLAGIGISYFSDSHIKDRDLGSRFQFEDRLGIGWQWDANELTLMYMHYSNAGIEPPNEGLDMILLSFAYTY